MGKVYYYSIYSLSSGAKIVTAPTGSEIHSRLGVEMSSKIFNECSFSSGNFILDLINIVSDNFYS